MGMKIVVSTQRDFSQQIVGWGGGVISDSNCPSECKEGGREDHRNSSVTTRIRKGRSFSRIECSSVRSSIYSKGRNSIHPKFHGTTKSLPPLPVFLAILFPGGIWGSTSQVKDSNAMHGRKVL